MALEMLIGRTFIPYFGGTIYTWGALISVFLAGMTVGYVAGGRAADRLPAARALSALFAAAAVAVLIVPLAGDALINRILDFTDDVRYAALLAALCLACVPAAVLAAVSPYCVRLLLERHERAGAISGRLSGLSTAGSILGTLGTSFFLIPYLGVHMIYGILAVAALFIALMFLFCSRRGVRPAQALAGLLYAGLLGAGLAPQDASAQEGALLMRRDGLLEKVDSEYNTILVEKQGPYISLNFGYRNNRYTESAVDLTRPDELVVPYTRYMSVALAYRQAPVRRIALVGLGGGRTIRYLVDQLPGAQADVAELDPSVIALARKYFGVESTARLHISNKDGRVFLNQSRERYDLILIDAYRGPFVPFHLTTREFYTLVRDRLSEGGVVAQNVEPSTMFFDSAHATMKAVFGSVDSFEANGNVVLVGYAGPRLSDAELAKRAGAFQQSAHLKYDLRELIRVRHDVQAAADAKVLTDDFAPVEMLKTVRRHNEKRE